MKSLVFKKRTNKKQFSNVFQNMKIFDNNDHLRTHKQVLLLQYKYFDNLLEPGVA